MGVLFLVNSWRRPDFYSAIQALHILGSADRVCAGFSPGDLIDYRIM
jgi:hypothetical protein